MKTLQAKIGENATLILQGARSKTDNYGKITDPKIIDEIDKLIRSFKSTFT